MDDTCTTSVCVDCAMAVVNADYTGMDADTELRVRDGIAETNAEGWFIVVDTDDVEDFVMHRPCGVCKSRLGGSRLAATLYSA